LDPKDRHRIKERELRLLNLREGYAGTTDVIFTFGKQGRGVLDYKTKKTRVGEKVHGLPGAQGPAFGYAAAYWARPNWTTVVPNVFTYHRTGPRRNLQAHRGPALLPVVLHLCESGAR
jgi:hypothetical protein